MLEPHLAEKNTKKNQNFDTLNPQPVQSFSSTHYTEKTRGFPHHQRPAPNLLGRCRPKVSTKCPCGIPTATPGINQHSPQDRLIPSQEKTNKQTKTKPTE
jgi:hypothetical protein